MPSDLTDDSSLQHSVVEQCVFLIKKISCCVAWRAEGQGGKVILVPRRQWARPHELQQVVQLPQRAPQQQ